MKTTIKHGLMVSLALLLSFASSAGGAAAAPTADDGPNFLENPGFEGAFNKQCCRTDLPPDKPPTPIDEIQMAPGWVGWWLEPGRDPAHPTNGSQEIRPVVGPQGADFDRTAVAQRLNGRIPGYFQHHQ